MDEFDESPGEIEGELKISPLFDKRAHKRWSVSLAQIDGYRRLHPGMEKERRPSSTLNIRRAWPSR